MFCEIIVVVILRGATPTGFLVRIAARGSSPDLFFFVIESLRSFICPGKVYFVSSAVWDFRLASAALWLGCGCY